MSDTTQCPLCHKYIDTTFAIDKCPKCHGSLKDFNSSENVNQTSDIIPAPNLRAKNFLTIGGSFLTVFLLTYYFSPKKNVFSAIGEFIVYAIILILIAVVSHKLAKGDSSWRILYLLGTIGFIYFIFKDQFSHLLH
ncbi:MAG: hypothetical protein ACR2GD_11105 [Pyrinomonadaceae bacterium]